MITADNVWERVKQYQNCVFHTVTGLEFTYVIEGEKVKHSRSSIAIHRCNFEKAVRMNPKKISDLQKAVVGPSYVYAIITDPRLQ